LLAELLLEAGEAQQALDLFATHKAHEAKFNYKRALALWLVGRPLACLRECERLLALNLAAPQPSVLHKLASISGRAAGQLEVARRHAALAPPGRERQIQELRCELEAGQAEAALRAAQSIPDTDEARRVCVDALDALTRVREALELHSTLDPVSHSERVGWILHHTLLQAQTGDFASAGALLEKAVALGPVHVAHRIFAAGLGALIAASAGHTSIVDTHKRELEEKLPALEEAVALRSLCAELLGWAELLRGDATAARAWWQRAPSSSPARDARIRRRLSNLR
jgi:tetratricopeptide (TPR) repeat protein